MPMAAEVRTLPLEKSSRPPLENSGSCALEEVVTSGLPSSPLLAQPTAWSVSSEVKPPECEVGLGLGLGLGSRVRVKG